MCLDVSPANHREPKTYKYHLHKATGCARTYIDGKTISLGKYLSPASLRRFERLVAEANAPSPPSETTVAEVMAPYLEHAKKKYSAKQFEFLRYPMRVVRELYNSKEARLFSVDDLRQVRQTMLDRGHGKRPGESHSRVYINESVQRIRRMFRWAAQKKMVPSYVWQDLCLLESLRAGQAGREPKSLAAVPHQFLQAVKPYVSRQVWAMIQLQLVTGMGPRRVVSLTDKSLDRSGELWKIRATDAGSGDGLTLGPEARKILEPFIKPQLENYHLFDPRDAQRERFDQKRAARKTKVQPSQRSRANRRPRRAPGPCYTVASFRRAIEHACDRADERAREQAEDQGRAVQGGERLVPRWTPLQLALNFTGAYQHGGNEGAAQNLVRILDDRNLLSARDISRIFELPFSVIRTRLDRYRKKNHSAYIENADGSSRDGRYLYRLGEVRPVVEAAKRAHEAPMKRA